MGGSVRVSSLITAWLGRVSIRSLGSSEEEMEDDVVLTKHISDKVVETSR